jgi:hypothetical protein
MLIFSNRGIITIIATIHTAREFTINIAPLAIVSWA